VAPYWDEEFRFEVAEDEVLQSEPIEFKVGGWEGGRKGERRGRRKGGRKGGRKGEVEAVACSNRVRGTGSLGGLAFLFLLQGSAR
jgi:hypothetical protein